MIDLFVLNDYDAMKEPMLAHRKHPRTGERQWCVVHRKKATAWFSAGFLAWCAWDAREGLIEGAA